MHVEASGGYGGRGAFVCVCKCGSEYARKLYYACRGTSVLFSFAERESVERAFGATRATATFSSSPPVEYVLVPRCPASRDTRGVGL
jgi:hypothetical protein